MRKAVPWVILGSLIVFHVLVDFWWIAEHRAYDGTSEGDLIAKALEFWDFWEEAPSRGERLRYLLGRERITDTPRFLSLYGYLSMKRYGRGIDALLYPMALWHGLLLLGTFLFGRITVGAGPALLGTALLGFMPQVYDYARSFNMYPVSAAIFLFALVALIRSKGFGRMIPSVVFALLVAWQMLTERGSPTIFLIGPMVVCLWPSAKEVWAGRHRFPFWRNLALGAAIFMLLVWPYLRGYLALGVGHIGERVTQPFFTPGDHWHGSKFTFLYYPVELALKQVGPLCALAFYLSLIALWRRPFPHRGVFVSAMAVPFFVFTLIATKDTTYVLAWLPLVALSVGYGVAALPKAPVRVAVGAFLLVVGAFNFLSFSFGLDWMDRANYGTRGERPVMHFLTNLWARFTPRPPVSSWRLEEAAQAIVAEIPKAGRVYLHEQYRPGHIDPNFDLAFAVAYVAPRVTHIIRFRPVPKGDADWDLTRVTILPTGAWEKAGCVPGETLQRLLLKFDTGRFIEHNDEEKIDFDEYLEGLERRELLRGHLAPDFPFTLLEAWPKGCAGDE